MIPLCTKRCWGCFRQWQAWFTCPDQKLKYQSGIVCVGILQSRMMQMVCHQGQVMNGIGTYKRSVNSATDFGEYDAANMNAATYMQRLQGDGAPCWVSRISRTIAHHGEPPVRRASPLKGNAAVSCAATIKSRYTSRWERIVMDESQAIMIVISRYELTAPWCWWCASALMLCGFNTINRCWIHTLRKQKMMSVIWMRTT